MRAVQDEPVEEKLERHSEQTGSEWLVLVETMSALAKAQALAQQEMRKKAKLGRCRPKADCARLCWRSCIARGYYRCHCRLH